MQVGDTLAPALHLPEWVNSLLAFFLILGFPMALFFAWAFELTPDGIKKEKDVNRTKSITPVTGRKLNTTIIGLLVVALGYFAYDKFVLDPREDARIAESARAESGPPVQAEDASDGPEEESIAVLPFVNMSSDAEQEYFSDGLSEELLNVLAKIPGLKVTSRSSAFVFKGQAVDIPTVAEKLGVAHVLEGSVRKAGNKVRITAQLIRAADDVHLWSETYDRELDDVFAIQDEIANQVVSALRVQLMGADISSIETNTEAYTQYLKGRHLRQLRTEDGYKASEQAYRDAIAIDPGYAQAWAGLSETLRQLANNGITDLHEGTEKARAAAIRALELDDSKPEAWAALASIQFVYDWDWDRGEATARTALQYGPGNVLALREMADILRGLGRPEEALEFSLKAVELDPLSRGSLQNLALTYWSLGRYDLSEAQYRRVLELYPGGGDISGMIGALLSLQGKSEEALPYIEAEQEGIWSTMFMAAALHRLGRTEESDLALQKLIDDYGYFGAFQVATVYALKGNPDKAFEWLEISYDQRDGGFTHILVDSTFKSIHNDPRWEEILHRVGLLPYWQEMQEGES
jgi:TolB-like protein